MTSSSAPPPTGIAAVSSSSGPHQPADILSRKRSKRTPIGPNYIDLRDPYGIIELAIRYDEYLARDEQGDEILKVPIESGPIYNHHAFLKALRRLHKKTAIPRNNNNNLHHNHYSSVEEEDEEEDDEDQPPQAITPVILSGLVAAVQESTLQVPSALDLVAYCRRMRRAALTRHQQRQRRRKIQRQVTPYVVSGILMSLISWSAMSVRSALIEYEFIGTEGATQCQVDRVCRMAATAVWKFIDPSNRLILPDCTLQECRLGEGQLEYPVYAMHTLLHNDILTLSELDNPGRPRRIPWSRHRKSNYINRPPLRWLGETIVNRLIRETIQEWISSTTTTTTTTTTPRVSILDYGCGVGGLLYSLLDSRDPNGQSFDYHGIALSAPEIHQAREFQIQHGLDSSSPPVESSSSQTNSQISFEQYDFHNDPMETKQQYSIIVAVESLSYSQDMSLTMKGLVSSMTKDGIMIIVDDVINPWVSTERRTEMVNALGKPSLKSYEEWGRLITSFPHLELVEVADLTLKYYWSDLNVDRDVAPTFFAKWGNFGYRAAEQIAEGWGGYFGTEFLESNIVIQIMKLVRDLAEVHLSTLARKLGYQQAELAYYFIILKKR